VNGNRRASRLRAARLLTNALNPFFIFTALYTFVAFYEVDALRATLYVGVELIAAAFVAGYVLLLQMRRRVGDFWISARAERLVPALVLLSAFTALLGAMGFLGPSGVLFRTTLSMGLASATVAAITLVWKVSAHSAVAGHAAAVGLLVLGLPGLFFAFLLPLVLWSRVASGAHTLLQTLAAAGVGAAFALLFLA
jgi:membrane-associated phospholipid phosphatase